MYIRISAVIYYTLLPHFELATLYDGDEYGPLQGCLE